VRKLVVSEFITLDGVIEDPSWTSPFSGEEQNKFKFDELAAAGALLLGRVTYEGFAEAWPQMEEETGEYGAWMNGYPKHVASTTLQEPLEWNNSRLIEGDVAEQVSELKQGSGGGDILVFGSGELAKTLTQNDLVDEYRLMIFPVVVGTGKRLFDEGTDTKTMKLVDTKTFGSGVVVLTYGPKEE
jgi:dihydrofolate reductase